MASGYRVGGISPGIIGEIGSSWPLTSFERRSLIAAAHVAATHGLALTVLANPVPLMRERCFTREEVNAILVDTPRGLSTRL